MKRSTLLPIALFTLALAAAVCGWADQDLRVGRTGLRARPAQGSATIYLPIVRTSSLFLNVSDGASAARTISVAGEYPASVADDLWIFVLPPNNRYYPQSFDACAQERTPKRNGRWEMRVGFGDASNTGLRFQMLLTAANTTASQFIVDTLKAWCQVNNYPGLVRLPEGVRILDKIEVVRSADIWGPAPQVSSADLPGTATITSPAANALVPQRSTVIGTYSPDGTADIWTLVFATNGRWYPQSQDACKGVGTIKSRGGWRVAAIFGGARNVGEPFDIVIVLANAEASAFFTNTQKQWCRANNYPGLITIELPQGIDEQSRIRVIRQ